MNLAPALVVVYTYHPNAQTLYDAHLKPKAPVFLHGRLQAQSTVIPERTIWSYVVQIANAIKAVHEAGQAVRMIDLTKVLVTGQNRYVGPCSPKKRKEKKRKRLTASVCIQSPGCALALAGWWM